MNFKTFEALMLGVKKELNDNYDREQALAKAFGVDSYIQIESKLIDSVVDIVMLDLGADDWIMDLLWEHLLNDEELTFEVNQVTYSQNLQNIWLYCKGDLTEKYSVAPNKKFVTDLAIDS